MTLKLDTIHSFSVRLSLPSGWVTNRLLLWGFEVNGRVANNKEEPVLVVE